MTDTPPPDDDRFDEPYDDVLDEDGNVVPPSDLDEVIAELQRSLDED